MSTRSNDSAMQQMDINELWNEKIQKLSRRVWAIAKGDDDFYQEGILGIRISLTRNPRATDAFLLSAAKWNMLHYRDKGASVDNGIKWSYTKRLADGTPRTYPKNMAPVYIDCLISNFRSEYPDSSYSPDILALDRAVYHEAGALHRNSAYSANVLAPTQSENQSLIFSPAAGSQRFCLTDDGKRGIIYPHPIPPSQIAR